MTGLDIQDRMLMIDRKLDAIMAFLGMKSPFPTEIFHQGSPQNAALAAKGCEPFMVFRNDAYENMSQGINVASQSFGDETYLSPDSQGSVSSHIAPAQFGSEIPDGSLDANEHLEYDVSGHPQSILIPHRDARYTDGSGASVDSPASPASIFSTILSSRSAESKGTDSNKSGKMSVTIYSESTKAPEAKALERNNQLEDGNKGQKESSRSDSKGAQTKNLTHQTINDGELSWRDIVPNIGAGDHDTSPIRGGKTATALVHRPREALASRASAPPKNRPTPRQPLHKAASFQGTRTSGKRSSHQQALSRREMLRTNTSQEKGPTNQVARVSSQDACSNVEVVKQIQQKILELRRRESLDKKPQEEPEVLRPHQVDRTALKYYNRVGRVQANCRS